MGASKNLLRTSTYSILLTEWVMLFLPSPGITLYQAIPYVAPLVSAYIHVNTILILCLPVLILGKIIQLAFRLKNSTPKTLKRESLSKLFAQHSLRIYNYEGLIFYVLFLWGVFQTIVSCICFADQENKQYREWKWAHLKLLLYF